MRDYIDFWFWSVALWTPPLMHPALRDAHRRARLSSKPTAKNAANNAIALRR